MQKLVLFDNINDCILARISRFAQSHDRSSVILIYFLCIIETKRFILHTCIVDFNVPSLFLTSNMSSHLLSSDIIT